MTEDLSVGARVAWYRRRRGMSQEALAGLVGRTADWLQKIERNRLELDRVSVIRALASALGVTLGELLAEPNAPEAKAQLISSRLDKLRATLTSYEHIAGKTSAIGEPPSVERLRAKMTSVWGYYQSSRYTVAAEWLPGLLEEAAHVVNNNIGAKRRSALVIHALTYHVTAALLTKMGEPHLGWIAAERGLTAARTTDDPVVTASLVRSVAHTLFANGRRDAATEFVAKSADDVRRIMRKPTPVLLSVFGTLLLTGAVSASNQGDRSAVELFLREAEDAATILGHDGNYLWTAFGPTNAAMHRVATSIVLHDVQIAVELGPQIDVRWLPLERRVRHALDLAHAWSRYGRRDQAISTLISAERAAPEQVRAHYLSRRLVSHWIRTQRTRPNTQLVGLVTRMDVLREL